MSPHEHQRAADDDAHRRIEDMLEGEEDPKERTRLLLMLRLNDVLVDNVVATRELTNEFKEHRGEFKDHRTEFDDHVQKEELLISKGRGAVWAAVVFLGVVQVMGGYIVSRHLGELSVALTVAMDNRTNLAAHKETHRAIEETLRELKARQ